MVVVVLAAVGFVVFAGDDDGDDSDTAEIAVEGENEADDDQAGADEGADDGDASGTGAAENTDGADPGDLPPPEVPEAADPPPLSDELAGAEFPYDPIEEIYWPAVGGLTVDPSPGEFVDTPVHLDEGDLIVSFPGGEGLDATVEAYGPDGEMVVTERVGDVAGTDFLEFTELSSTGSLAATGTYVFRVILHDGPGGGVNLAFFRPD